MKLYLKKDLFEDKETKKKVEYESICAKAEINGLVYELTCKFNSKTEKQLVLDNLANSELTTETVEYRKQDGTNISYTNAIVEFCIDNKKYKVNAIMRSKAEIFIIDVCNQ